MERSGKMLSEYYLRVVAREMCMLKQNMITTSAASMMKSSTSRDLKAKRSRVAFRKSVTARRALHLKDFTDEEIRNCWLSVEELEICSQDIIRTIELVSNGCDQECCRRGTEQRTQEGNMKRQRNKKMAWLAVLQEQEAQWEKGVIDDEAIAAAYHNASSHCLTEARIRARRDQEDALLSNLGIHYLSTSPDKAFYQSVLPQITKGCHDCRRHALFNAAA